MAYVKLDKKDRKKVFDLYDKHNLTQVAIAMRFGVTPSCINVILRKRKEKNNELC